jgi:hypothetical protein
MVAGEPHPWVCAAQAFLGACGHVLACTIRGFCWKMWKFCLPFARCSLASLSVKPRNRCGPKIRMSEPLAKWLKQGRMICRQLSVPAAPPLPWWAGCAQHGRAEQGKDWNSWISEPRRGSQVADAEWGLGFSQVQVLWGSGEKINLTSVSCASRQGNLGCVYRRPICTRGG